MSRRRVRSIGPPFPEVLGNPPGGARGADSVRPEYRRTHHLLTFKNLCFLLLKITLPQWLPTHSPILTVNNNLLERSKKVVVYFSPARECRTLRQIADVIPLLEHCPKAAMEEFESMIDLAARIAQPQASLNLV